ncbi:MAG: glutathione S-transferase family protein [Pseudomonadales bacterium]
MKLYDVTQAPNPRRVRVFLAEKGIEVPLVQVDMQQGEHKTPEFLRKNPSGKVPVLELDDGTCIGESVAICRYFEALQPEPPLFGRSPVEIGRIDMANRQLEFELLGPVGQAWVNGPIVARMAAGRFTQIPEAKAQGEKAARAFYQRLDRQLAAQPFMAGEAFSVADITALCVIDFASKLVNLEPDRALANLWRWHDAVSSRPSASA